MKQLSYLEFCFWDLINNNLLSNDEKVILMKLGLNYGVNLYEFNDNEDEKEEFKSLKSLKQICYKYKLNYYPNIYDIIQDRINISINSLLKYNEGGSFAESYHLSKDILISLIRYSQISNKDKDKILDILTKFCYKFEKLRKIKKWSLLEINLLVNSIFSYKYNEIWQ